MEPTRETISSLKATHTAFLVANEVANPRTPALEEVIPKQPSKRSLEQAHRKWQEYHARLQRQREKLREEEPRELVYYEVVPDAAWKASQRRITIIVLVLFAIFLGIMCYIARDALFRG